MKKLNESTILVVDDSIHNLDIMVSMLDNLYDVIVASNGESALELIDELTPDLILLDIVMDGIDGFEVCKRLKDNSKTAAIPVIFLSGNKDAADKNRGFEYGAVDYITKPFEVNEVKARIKTHLSLKIAQEELKNQNAKLESEVEKRTFELQKTVLELRYSYQETIFLLSKAAEYRDDDTGSHLLKVSSYCKIIAGALGLEENMIENLYYASLLHDIGKIGIPDKILLKKGSYDSEEWNIMKKHTVIGSSILSSSNVEVIKMGKMIALTHHEKWDGSGYPKGLSYEEIPLISRIVSVADVFDALVSKRVYKNEFTVEDALFEIKKSSGNHFDPKVVDAFLSVFDDILVIMKRYKESHLIA